MASLRATSHGEHPVQLIRMRFSNCYLVREDDGLTLLDTSLKGSGAAILSEAQRAGAPIRRIVVTHAHSDHYGALDELHRLLPDAEVLVSDRDARLLRGDLTRPEGEPEGRCRRSSPGTSRAPTGPRTSCGRWTPRAWPPATAR